MYSLNKIMIVGGVVAGISALAWASGLPTWWAPIALVEGQTPVSEIFRAVVLLLAHVCGISFGIIGLGGWEESIAEMKLRHANEDREKWERMYYRLERDNTLLKVTISSLRSQYENVS